MDGWLNAEDIVDILSEMQVPMVLSKCNQPETRLPHKGAPVIVFFQECTDREIFWAATLWRCLTIATNLGIRNDLERVAVYYPEDKTYRPADDSIMDEVMMVHSVQELIKLWREEVEFFYSDHGVWI